MLPALSGLLLALCYPPLHPLVLPFVALVPIALWLHDLPAEAKGAGAAARGGALFGAVHFGLVLYWIPIALSWLTPLGPFAFLLVLAGLSALTAGFGWLVHRALHALGAPLWLALPVVWVGLEWTLAHLPSTLAFPWLGLGTTLTGFPELVGIAELVGARGVGFWIALVSGVIATLLVRLRSGGPWRALAASLAAVLVGPMAWGVARAASLELRPAARVAVVQPDIEPRFKLDPSVAMDSTFAALDRLVPRIEPGSVDLVILPEVALPIHPQIPGSEGALARLQAHAREVGAPVLFGALGVASPGPPVVPYNSAFLVEPQGLTDFRYDKHRLVPIVERVPFLPSRVFGAERDLGAYGVGEGWPLAEVDETAFGVLICYESAWADATRAYRRAGADVLVNITNDAWYGGSAWYARTTAFWQHPAHLVMRAIETRAGVARAANTGISLFVDPIGRIHAPTALDTESVLVGEVLTTDRSTVHVRYGDLVGNACAIAVLALVLVAVARPSGSHASVAPQRRAVDP